MLAVIESRPTFFKHVQRKTGLWVPAPLRFAAWYPCCLCKTVESVNLRSIYCDWDVVSGTWTDITYPEGRETLSDGAKLLSQKHIKHRNFFIRFRRGSNLCTGQKIKLFFGDDGDDTWYAEYTIGTWPGVPGTIKVFSPTGQVGETRTSKYLANGIAITYYSICLWTNTDGQRILSAGITWGSSPVQTRYFGFTRPNSDEFFDTRYGIGGDANGNNLGFLNAFHEQREDRDCDECRRPCGGCDWQGRPAKMLVDIDGSSCPEFESPLSCVRGLEHGANVNDWRCRCYCSGDIGNDKCISVQVTGGASSAQIKVLAWHGANGGRWIKNYDAPLSCIDLSDESIPWDCYVRNFGYDPQPTWCCWDEYTTGITPLCDFAGTTANVSAVL